jgi:hypothetical protein
VTFDSLTYAREREAKARELLHEASQNPAVDVCDDAWMTAAIFMALLDAERLAPDPARLAKAMRYVERVRDLREGVSGGEPSPEFYEEYAADVVAAYTHGS